MTETAVDGSPRIEGVLVVTTEKKKHSNLYQETHSHLFPQVQLRGAFLPLSDFFSSFPPFLPRNGLWPLSSTAQHTSLPPQAEGPQHGCRQNKGSEVRGMLAVSRHKLLSHTHCAASAQRVTHRRLLSPVWRLFATPNAFPRRPGKPRLDRHLP